MLKSKIVTIGTEFFNIPQQVIRMYEKITTVKVKEEFKYSSLHFMNSNYINKVSAKKLNQYYKVFEPSILDDENLNIFCFNSMEDFETFDIHGILKEKSLVIDKIEEEEYGMTIWELLTYCNKSHKIHNNGEHKVVLFDALTGKEYTIREFEPRREFVKETDKTVEFSIYPVKIDSVKEVKKVSVSEFVQSKLEEHNKNPNWLANEMNISTSSIYGKIDRDSFNAYDLLNLTKIFNLSLEELLEKTL
ncbi:hypothetical protein P4T70_23255 [Bacillus mobilis]|uniref:hypothetical protein n=1 Tax=Bacillus mobilis TaxID=2026190 RepID=UPI002E227B96|nr:hypothetical protein [Bacillus mobilis]